MEAILTWVSLNRVAWVTNSGKALVKCLIIWMTMLGYASMQSENDEININIAVVHSIFDSVTPEVFLKAAEDHQKLNSKLNITFIFILIERDENVWDKFCSEMEKLNGKEIDAIIGYSITTIYLNLLTIKETLHGVNIPKIYAGYAIQDLDHDDLYNHVQFQIPGDVIGELVRDIAHQSNVTNGVVLFDENIDMYTKFRHLLRNLPMRHIIMRITERTQLSIQITSLRDIDNYNYYIVGSRPSAEYVLDVANDIRMLSRSFSWTVITTDNQMLNLTGIDCNIMLATPIIQNQIRMEKYNTPSTSQHLVDASFTYDFINVILTSIINLKKAGKWVGKPALEFDCINTTMVTNSMADQFNAELNKTISSYLGTYGRFMYTPTNQVYMEFIMNITIMKTLPQPSLQPVGLWTAGIPDQNPVTVKEALEAILPITTYQVVAVESPPFVYKILNSNGSYTYTGYCVDMLNLLKEEMKFEYDIYNAPNNEFGTKNDKTGQWNGLIGEIVSKRAHIGLGPLFVMSEREKVVDYTIPFYDLVGMKILMKKPVAETSLFKFLVVMEPSVWVAILGAYLVTSLLLWLIDTYSPFSYQNNKEKYLNDPEKREFNLKESLWFCITSLTPQGGGEAPKNISGRLVAATWWLFSFIVIASYTANLAAFLTVSRLDSQIETLDGLANQFKIQYAPVNNSATMRYFERMADIEDVFYDKWNQMTMGEDFDFNRIKYSVFDYPVGDRYTKIWQSMQETGMPNSLQEGIERIRNSDGTFALITDTTEAKYAAMSHCDLMVVGEEFCRRPLGLAVLKGSVLKEKLSAQILKLQNKRQLEALKDKWWNNNPYKRDCEEEEIFTDGISIKNIGGVFIVIFVGMVIAWFILGFEYCWYRVYKRNTTKVKNIQTTVFKPDASHAKSIYDNQMITNRTLVFQPVTTKRYYFSTT